jgi:hypothetical protein
MKEWRAFSADGRRGGRRGLVAGAALLAALCAARPCPAGETSFAAPTIYDFFFRYQDNPTPDMYPIPLPAPGMGGIPADDPIYADLFQDLINVNLPVGVILPDHLAPLTGWVADTTGDGVSDSLPTILGYAPRLDYVLLDFESPERQANMIATFEMVRSHERESVRNARIGNYAYFAGHPDVTVPTPDDIFADLIRHSFYVQNPDLNVAMPHAYVFAIFRNHTLKQYWGENIAPNQRAALFWAPLERVSLAKRALPDGHELIPWIGGFLSQGLNVDPPTREDVLLMMLHYRMRGIDGYATFQSDVPVPYNEYRRLMGWAFHSLDCFFDGEEPPIFHNLETSKTTGLQWSGITAGMDSAFVISNLGDEPAAVGPSDGWPTGLPGVPVVSPTVAPGEHLALFYDFAAQQECVEDCNGNGEPDAWDVLLGTSEDCDFDGVPDECQICCPADLNGDGGVTVDDLLEVIFQWGNEISHADVNLDGAVNVDDLIVIIQNWGGCF